MCCDNQNYHYIVANKRRKKPIINSARFIMRISKTREMTSSLLKYLNVRYQSFLYPQFNYDMQQRGIETEYYVQSVHKLVLYCRIYQKKNSTDNWRILTFFLNQSIFGVCIFSYKINFQIAVENFRRETARTLTLQKYLNYASFNVIVLEFLCKSNRKVLSIHLRLFQ